MISLDADSLPRLTAHEARELEKLPPAVRGYWLDQELLEASGLGSTAVLKRAQAVGWLQPNHVPLPGGGRRRAWTLREVAHAELLVQVAQRALIPVQSAAALLASAGRGWVDSAMGMDAQLREAAGHGASAIPVAGTRLLLIDMKEAWAETDKGDFLQIAKDMVLVGPNNLYRASEVVPEMPAALRISGRAALDSLLDGASVATLIDLEAIPLHSIDAARETLTGLR